MSYKVWIGKRESDISTYGFFNYSITFYGSNTGNNVSYCTTRRIRANHSSDFVHFVAKKISLLMMQEEKIEIHFYNNQLAYKIIGENPNIKNRIVNLNSLSVLDILRHKTLSRVWLTNSVSTPAFCLLSKNECTIDYLQKKFGMQFHSFIVQKNYSSGGVGTFIINNDNYSNMIKQLKENELYLVSPYYYPNIPLSCHILIDDCNCIVFPVSEQILYTNNNKLEYMGNKYLRHDSPVSTMVSEAAKTIGLRIQKLDYRGICGLDFIYYDNKVMLIEINPRYQGSSYIINYALFHNNLPSLFELNSMCFNDIVSDSIIERIEKISMPYANKYLEYHSIDDLHEISHILTDKNNLVFLDGYNNATQFENECYLLRYLFPCEEL